MANQRWASIARAGRASVQGFTGVLQLPLGRSGQVLGFGVLNGVEGVMADDLGRDAVLFTLRTHGTPVLNVPELRQGL